MMIMFFRKAQGYEKLMRPTTSWIYQLTLGYRLSNAHLGGLEVDETTGNVINTQGEAIKGLFAAGDLLWVYVQIFMYQVFQ